MATMFVAVTLAACTAGGLRGYLAKTPQREECIYCVAVALSIDESGLLEISAGSDDGLRSRMSGLAYRGDEFLGKVVVERTSSDRSKARVELAGPIPIRKGDHVTFDGLSH